MPKVEFRATLREGRGGGAQVALPADASDVFGTRARFPVRATFNGIAYRGSTMPMGDGTFCVGVTKTIRAEAGIGIGDEVDVTIERDDDERTVDVPAELAAALDASGLTARFEQMAFTHRREYARWIAEAKRLETRRVRVARAVDMIGAGAQLS